MLWLDFFCFYLFQEMGDVDYLVVIDFVGWDVGVFYLVFNYVLVYVDLVGEFVLIYKYRLVKLFNVFG